MVLRLNTSSNAQRRARITLSRDVPTLIELEPARMLQAAAKASHALLSSSFEAGVRGALEALGEGLRMDRIYAVRYDHALAAGFLVAEYSAPGIETVAARVGAGPYGFAEFEEVWRPLMAGGTYGLSGSEKAPLHLEMNRETGTKSDYFVPIFVSGAFWGTIGFGDCTVERVLREPEIQILHGAAAAVAAAVARDEAEKTRRCAEAAVSQRLEQHARILGTVKILLEGSDFEAGLLKWLAELGWVMKASRAVCYDGFVHVSSGQATVRPFAEWTEQKVRGAFIASVDTSNVIDPRDAVGVLDILSQGKCVVLQLDEVGDPIRRLFRKQGEATMLVVPVRLYGRTPGAIGLTFAARHEFAPDILAALETAADTFSVAVQREGKQQKSLEAERERTAEAQELSRLMEGIVAASRALLDAPSFDDGLQSWLAYLGKTVDADHAMLGGFPSTDDKQSVAIALRLWDKAGRSPNEDVTIPDTLDFREWAQRLAAGQAVWVHRDELMDPASIKFWEACNCYTDLIVPIVSAGRTVGWLSFDWTSRRERKESYRTLLRTAADGAAAAISRNEVERVLLAERELRAADLTRANQALRQAIAGLASLSELDVFLADMLRESLNAVGADCGVIELCEGMEIQQRLFIDNNGDLLSGADDELSCVSSSAPPDLLSAVAALEHDQVITGLAPEDAVAPPAIRELVRTDWPSSVTMVPLRVGKRILGWMGFGFNGAAGLASEKAALLRVLGDQITLALQFSRLAQEAQSAATQSAVLRERNRLARDLHDTLAQGFAGVIAQLGAAEGAIELRLWNEATAYFERAKRLARFSLAEARSSVHALRPETSVGPLRQRIERMVSVVTHGTGLDSVVREDGTPVELTPTVDWCAYKFVQEALANAVKHSGAKRFVVELVWGIDCLTVSAADNGRGFELDQVSEGLGLLSMRERAGEAGGYLRQEAQPAGGTRLCLHLPLCPIQAL